MSFIHVSSAFVAEYFINKFGFESCWKEIKFHRSIDIKQIDDGKEGLVV